MRKKWISTGLACDQWFNKDFAVQCFVPFIDWLYIPFHNLVYLIIRELLLIVNSVIFNGRTITQVQSEAFTIVLMFNAGGLNNWLFMHQDILFSTTLLFLLLTTVRSRNIILTCVILGSYQVFFLVSVIE